MKNNLKAVTLLGLALVFTASLAHAQLGTGTGTTSVSVTVGAEAGLTVVTGATTISSVGTNFAPYTGTTNLTYFMRTTKVGGTGTLTLKVTTDFPATGGPSVGSPPTGTDTLAYTCTVSAPGTACAGSQTSSTAASTSVGTWGTDAHSIFAGDAASVAWTLTNDPLYKTGSYSATVTFTISAA